MTRVLAVNITPNTNGLPGLNELSTLVGALLTVAAIACVGGLVACAIAWAVGAHSSNVQVASKGKSGTIICFAAALLVGAASVLVTFFVNAGAAL